MNCKKNSLYAVKSILLILMTLFSLPLIELGFSQTASIYLYPSLFYVAVDRNFTVEIKISSVIDLYGWEFKLRWDPTLLDVVDVFEASFLKSGGLTFFAKKINNTVGYVLVDCTLLGAIPGVSGDGTLATVQFYGENAGSSALDLYDTMLVNSAEALMPHTVSGGSVQVLPDVHDVAVTGVVPSKTVVGEGLTMRIWLIAENQGSYLETFSVAVNYDTTNQIGIEPVTLESGGLTTITFSWNTSGIAKGNYVLGGVASSVLEEIDLADNTYVDGTVTLAAVGDITGPIYGVPDGKVDVRDIAMIAKAFGSYPSRPNWIPNADINDDSKVDIKDIAIAAKRFGTIDP